MSEPVDFATLPGPGDGEHVSLMRLTDGRVSCCICFEFFHTEQLALAENGKRWDVCQPCWDWETSRPGAELVRRCFWPDCDIPNCPSCFFWDMTYWIDLAARPLTSWSGDDA